MTRETASYDLDLVFSRLEKEMPGLQQQVASHYKRLHVAGKAKGPQVDVTPTWPSQYDPLPPWPHTRPPKRPIPYGKPGPTERVLVLPGRIEYDPVMTKVEGRIYSLLEAGKNAVIVVPNIWRCVGEIMSRRLGVDLMVINCALRGSVDLPVTYSFNTFLESRDARRRCLRAADRVFIVDSCVAYAKIVEDVERLYPDKKVRTFKHMYRPRKQKVVEDNADIPKKKKRRLTKSDDL